jgi:hypothetical protein
MGLSTLTKVSNYALNNNRYFSGTVDGVLETGKLTFFMDKISFVHNDLPPIILEYNPSLLAEINDQLEGFMLNRKKQLDLCKNGKLFTLTEYLYIFRVAKNELQGVKIPHTLKETNVLRAMMEKQIHYAINKALFNKYKEYSEIGNEFFSTIFPPYLYEHYKAKKSALKYGKGKEAREEVFQLLDSMGMFIYTFDIDKPEIKQPMDYFI